MLWIDEGPLSTQYRKVRLQLKGSQIKTGRESSCSGRPQEKTQILENKITSPTLIIREGRPNLQRWKQTFNLAWVIFALRAKRTIICFLKKTFSRTKSDCFWKCKWPYWLTGNAYWACAESIKHSVSNAIVSWILLSKFNWACAVNREPTWQLVNKPIEHVQKL